MRLLLVEDDDQVAETVTAGCGAGVEVGVLAGAGWPVAAGAAGGVERVGG